MSGAAPDQILLDPYVEAAARALCIEAGHDPDEVAPIAGAEVIVDGVRQPAEMTGPRWIAYAVEAAERLDEAQAPMAAQFVRTPGRA